MKLRSALLVLAALLLLSSLVSATALSTPADPAGANLSAIFAAPASAEVGSAQLPSFAPSPTEKSLLSTCGSCSETVCVGKTVGTICRIQGGATYTCQHAYVICAAKDCECWTGPLP